MLHAQVLNSSEGHSGGGFEHPSPMLAYRLVEVVRLVG
jgi:hypothetical protein